MNLFPFCLIGRNLSVIDSGIALHSGFCIQLDRMGNGAAAGPSGVSEPN